MTPTPSHLISDKRLAAYLTALADERFIDSCSSADELEEVAMLREAARRLELDR